MQIQPKASLRQSRESRRARQAALIADDTFKGGARVSPSSAGLLRNPWHSGIGQLWGRARKRDSEILPD